MVFDFEGLATRDLTQLLAATAVIHPSNPSRRKLGGRHSPGNEAWIVLPDKRELVLSRSKPLSAREASILAPYARALADLNGVADPVARSAADDVLLRAISIQLGQTKSHVVEDALRFLMRSAFATYEGQAVALNLLLDLDLQDVHPAMVSLEKLGGFDWHAVLGSGAATAILVDCAGQVSRHLDVREEVAALPRLTDALAPHAFEYLTRWTTAGNRIALSLTRNAEIVIQQEGELRYIYRSARWHALPLDNALSKGWSPGSQITRPLKRIVLSAAIDASLAHHGACLAVVTPSRIKQFKQSSMISKSNEWLNDPRSRLFPTDDFAALSRRQRLELLSMDGATVLDARGKILASGAIVQVPGGSAGGGRLAAAMALADYGSALKVSQDGPIRLFGYDGSSVKEQLALG